MRKKAFTLYEVAVVLIVIGIILGMLFQTASLTNVAKLKKDCSVIETFRSALVNYSQAYQMLPGDDTGSGLILLNDSDKAMAKLIVSGLVTKEEFKYTILEPGGNGDTDFYTFRFTRCVTNDGSFDTETSRLENDVHSYAIRNDVMRVAAAPNKPPMPLGNICIGLHDFTAKNPCLDHKANANVDNCAENFFNGNNINDFDGRTPKNLAAAFELYFDDGDFNLGVGRRAALFTMPFRDNIVFDADPLKSKEELRRDLKSKDLIKNNYLGEGGQNIYLFKVW